MRGTPALFYQSLNRPFNIIGINKQLFFLILSLSGSFISSGIFLWNIKSILFGLFIFFVSAVVARRITLSDQDMISVYRRHISQKKYYAPMAACNADIPMTLKSVPKPSRTS
jgi:type IV secretory pathway TrbD component